MSPTRSMIKRKYVQTVVFVFVHNTLPHYVDSLISHIFWLFTFRHPSLFPLSAVHNSCDRYAAPLLPCGSVLLQSVVYVRRMCCAPLSLPPSSFNPLPLPLACAFTTPPSIHLFRKRRSKKSSRRRGGKVWQKFSNMLLFRKKYFMVFLRQKGSRTKHASVICKMIFLLRTLAHVCFFSSTPPPLRLPFYARRRLRFPVRESHPSPSCSSIVRSCVGSHLPPRRRR